MADQFLLWVDGVGGYRVCLGARARIGQAVPGSVVEVPVLADIARQLSAGERRIMGVMIESNLVAGRQDVVPGKPLVYGQSITDGCIDWATTETVLHGLAGAVDWRRSVKRELLASRQGAA